MQDVLPPQPKEFRDDWGTSARQGYEDTGPARPMKSRSRDGGSLLKSVGSLAIVGGIFWTTYLVAQSGSVNNLVAILEENHGPIAIIGMGAVSCLLGKYLRI